MFNFVFDIDLESNIEIELITVVNVDDASPPKNINIQKDPNTPW